MINIQDITPFMKDGTLQEVADYDKDATVGLASDSELNFDVNKDLELKDD